MFNVSGKNFFSTAAALMALAALMVCAALMASAALTRFYVASPVVRAWVNAKRIRDLSGVFWKS